MKSITIAKYIKVLAIIAAPAFLILAGCNENPTAMGTTLLRDTVAVYPISSSDAKIIKEAESYRHFFDFLNFGAINIGKYDEYEARVALRFNEPIKKNDSLDFLADFTTEDLIECKIIMPVNRYAVGDTTNPSSLSFNIYKVTDYWSNLANWDSLFNSGIVNESQPLGTFDKTIEKDAPPCDIEFDFDKSTAIEWFDKQYKYKQEDSTQVIWGIAFVPNQNSSVIRQFSGPAADFDNETTRLFVSFRNEENEIDTLYIESGVEKTFYQYPEPKEDYLTIQGGISTRGLLRFDASMIDKLSAIHSARLELNIDYSESLFGNMGMDSTLYGELPADTANYDNDDDFIRTYYAEKQEDKFVFTSVTSAIEHWNRREGEGLIVFHSEGRQNEMMEMDKIAFYGPNHPEESKRPKIVIIYSTRPEDIE